jgi:hypothetical protein
MFDHVALALELVLLVLIWRDGRGMLRSSLNMESMYERWFNERREEREARRESARKARETKAAKSAEAPNDK